MFFPQTTPLFFSQPLGAVMVFDGPPETAARARKFATPFPRWRGKERDVFFLFRPGSVPFSDQRVRGAFLAGGRELFVDQFGGARLDGRSGTVDIVGWMSLSDERERGELVAWRVRNARRTSVRILGENGREIAHLAPGARVVAFTLFEDLTLEGSMSEVLRAPFLKGKPGVEVSTPYSDRGRFSRVSMASYGRRMPSARWKSVRFRFRRPRHPGDSEA